MQDNQVGYVEDSIDSMQKLRCWTNKETSVYRLQEYATVLDRNLVQNTLEYTLFAICFLFCDISSVKFLQILHKF